MGAHPHSRSLIRGLTAAAHSIRAPQPCSADAIRTGLSLHSQFPCCTSEMFLWFPEPKADWAPSVLPAQLSSSWGQGKAALPAEIPPLISETTSAHHQQHGDAAISSEQIFCFNGGIKVTDCTSRQMAEEQRHHAPVCVPEVPELLKALLPGQLPPSGTWLHFRNQSVSFKYHLRTQQDPRLSRAVWNRPWRASSANLISAPEIILPGTLPAPRVISTFFNTQGI